MIKMRPHVKIRMCPVHSRMSCVNSTQTAYISPVGTVCTL
uniref:Uncharacterized protein n=1 Tax=Anguilla anguilla TaxID=7936 RepID=A0A0E9PVN6_ANGAN